MFPPKLPKIVSNAVTIGICLSNKIGYNSAYIRDIREIFVYNSGFSGSGYGMTPDKFYRDQPPLPWQ